MSVPPALVVDASVAAKWHLIGERNTREATLLRDRFDEGRTDLAAPAFIRYEIANVLRQASRSGKWPDDQAARAFEQFLGFDIHEDSDSNALISTAQLIAFETGATVYDATYIAYAALRGFELVTDDRELAVQARHYGISAHLLSELDLS